MMKAVFLPLVLCSLEVAVASRLFSAHDFSENLAKYVDKGSPSEKRNLPPGVIQQRPFDNTPIGTPTGSLATNYMLEFKCPDFVEAANLPGIGQGELYSCPDLCGVMHPAYMFKSLQEDDNPLYPRSFWQYNAFASYPYPGDTRNCSSGAPLIKTDAVGAIDDLCEDIVENCDPWCDLEADIQNDVLGDDGSDLECYCDVLKVRIPGIAFGACEGSISGEYSIPFATGYNVTPTVDVRQEARVNYDVYEILSGDINDTFRNATSDSVLYTSRYNVVVAEGTKVMAFLPELLGGRILGESCTYSVNDEFECACVPDTAPACIGQPLLLCSINGETVSFNCAVNTFVELVESIVNALAATPSPEPVLGTPSAHMDSDGDTQSTELGSDGATPSPEPDSDGDTPSTEPGSDGNKKQAWGSLGTRFGGF